MAPMLAAMLPTCHFPSPESVAREVVFWRVNTVPSLSVWSGSDLGRMRLSIVDVRGRGEGSRLCCDVGWRRAVGGDCSLEPSDFGGRQQEMNAVQMREKVSKLGRAGLLAYGLFNGIIYTTFFFIVFLAFEKNTGQNPANNLKGCLSGMVTMWTGNNFTRPLRVAGAAAMAPRMDKILKKTQKVLKFEDEASAFLFLVILLFALCGSSVGLLILSRMGR